MKAVTLGVLLAGLILLPARITAAEDSFRITGAVDHPQEWTAAQLVKQYGDQAETVRFTTRGEAHTARCVPLGLLVKPAQARLENEVKNHELGFAIFVRGRDGYTVCFSYAELMPELSHRHVWLALEVDGKPLAGKESPVRLLVPEDVKPARWTYGVSSITLVDGRRQAK
jgi:hypothetical protein